MNPPLGTDIDPDMLGKIEGLFSGQYRPQDGTEEALLRELAFWRWVAYEGYGGKPVVEFPADQRKFMLDCFRKTGWPLEEFGDTTIFELGCGPLGMIEFVPASRRYAFDPLNSHYSRLFGEVRGRDIIYLDTLDALASVPPAGFGICFNVLDHTPDAEAFFRIFIERLAPGARFLLQVNTVREGFERSAEHLSMHPSPMTFERIVGWISSVASDFRYELSDAPSADNEFFFMSWGRLNGT